MDSFVTVRYLVTRCVLTYSQYYLNVVMLNVTFSIRSLFTSEMCSLVS